MSFIENGEKPRLWVIGKLPLWRQLVVSCGQHCGFDPKIMLYGHDNGLFYELQDPLFDAIFVPQVAANWHAAKTEIDGLIKLWIDMSRAITNYSHWFVDPHYSEYFKLGVREQLRRIYSLCHVSAEDADEAFDAMVALLLTKAIEDELSVIQEIEGELDKYGESKAGAIERALYLASWLNWPSDEFAARIKYYQTG